MMQGCRRLLQHSCLGPDSAWGKQRRTGAPGRSPGAAGTLRRWDGQRARLLPAQFLHTGFGSHSSSLT